MSKHTKADLEARLAERESAPETLVRALAELVNSPNVTRIRTTAKLEQG